MTLTYLFPALLAASTVFAQQLNHPLMASRDEARVQPRMRVAAAETINALAVMVQFQPDNDIGTTGDGRFDLSTPAQVTLDSPPHDRRYFSDHLTFLSNYFAKVSKGKLVVRATLIDSVFTLPHQMARYSPPKNGPNTAVGDLARDTWQMVDASGLVGDFSLYDCFLLFHAGVGRDIDLVSVLGYDPTPRDIPSLYLSLNAFKQFFGSTYEGIPVRNGFHITNTIVMPETEGREIPATPQNFFLSLSINGLLCASFGSYLGLPDLFDTNTGRSGIGRFGLMDGQAIFSFAGIFPPEPSAWEKYWLGWIEPIVLTAGQYDVQLPAVSLSDTVYRIPISDTEYFLMENRSRDALRNGARVLSAYGGVVRVQTFDRDTVGFSQSDLSAIRGNVLDVDEFDWSLPGGVGRTGVFYDGGVLIWHIDERVIARGLPTNSVNANPQRRGVDLEEADGSQDIGQSYGLLQPGAGSEGGTALDFWYRGNESPVYRNEFSSTSYPNTASNSGANSHIAIKDFSTRSPRMSATVVVGDVVTLLPNFPKRIDLQLAAPSLTVAPIRTPDSLAIVVATTKDVATRPARQGPLAQGTRGELYAWKVNGESLLPRPLFARAGGTAPLPGGAFVGAPAFADINDDGTREAVIAEETPSGGVLHVYEPIASPTDTLARERLSLRVARKPTTSPLVTDSIIAFGAARATVYRYFYRSARLDSIALTDDTSDVVGIAAVANDHHVVFTTASGRVATTLAFASIDQHAGVQRASRASTPPVIGWLNARHPLVLLTTLEAGYVSAFDLQSGLQRLPRFPIDVGEPITSTIALADLDGDGSRDIIFFTHGAIHAYNAAGASLDNFPKRVIASEPLTSNPVVADLDGDGLPEVIAVSGDGIVVAFDKRGAMPPGFPLQAGRGKQSVAAFSSSPDGGQRTEFVLVVASSEEGNLSAWRTGSRSASSTVLRGSTWLQYQAHERHAGQALEALPAAPLTNTFFPKERAYNWPNPVYDGRTFIRYFVSENATVKIKIFDIAGDKVAEFAGPGIGGMDNEVAWNVRDIQSGVYLARIEADADGKSEVAIIKVAVVK